MSNKIVPTIYRAVIEDVISAIKPEFDEYGVGEDVLAELHQKWQHKVMASGVAEFEPTAPAPPTMPAHSFPMHPVLATQQPPYLAQTNAYITPATTAPVAAATSNPVGAPGVKVEQTDLRYPLGYPTLPGPQIPGTGQVRTGQPILQYAQNQQMAALAAQVRAATQASASGAAAARYPLPAPAATNGRIPQTDGPSGSSSSGVVDGPRIPQVDGPSSSSSEDEQSYAPRSQHPSLPQPSQASTSAVPDDEAINSDLDDSDDEEGEEDEGAAGATKDLVFCTYDKVARVRNKWKCILKDGMIHINGKDYLFSKCTGEFEW